MVTLKTPKQRRHRFICLVALLYAMSAIAAPSASTPPTDKQAYADFAAQNKGDAEQGKQLFANEAKLACIRCHTTDGSSAKAGPDLVGVGDRFPRGELIRSILEPSSTIAIGYGGTILETKSGETFEGIVKQATEAWVELMGGDGKLVRVATGDIKEQRISKLSLMPEGTESALTLPEFADLVAYLESLHQSVKTLAPSPAMPDVIPQATRAVEFRPFFSSDVRLHHPVWFGEMPGHTNLFVVLEQAGKSWLIERTPEGDKQTAWLDLSGEVYTGGGCGLLGMAFHPRFSENRKYYLKYQVAQGAQISTLLVERKFAKDFRSDSAEPPRRIMEIPAVTQDHTGGGISFGPDGFLYLGMGDTGPQGDPQGHAQDLNLLLGKILRIDVNHARSGRAYAIPKSNPFRKRTDVRPEIWAYGFREPWRFSFDSATGDLWIGDVGQSEFEEITLARSGENHGWNIMEGATPFSERYRRTAERYVPPIFSYPHRRGVSVTGGYVYRGQRAPQLKGHYICGDFESRRLWALTQTERTLTSIVEIGRSPARVVSFAEDSKGELYVVGYDTGTIYQMNLAVADPTPL